MTQSMTLATRHVSTIIGWYILCRWLIATFLLAYSLCLFFCQPTGTLPDLRDWALGIPLSAALITGLWLVFANTAVYYFTFHALKSGIHEDDRIAYYACIGQQVIIDWLALSMLILMTGTERSMELVYAFLAHGVLCANVLRRHAALLYVVLSVFLAVGLAVWLVMMRRCNPAATGSRVLLYAFLLLLLSLTQFRIRGMREETYGALQSAVASLRVMNRERINFLTSATHHMKAPLAVISNYLRLFQDGYLAIDQPKGKAVLADMQDRCQGAMSHLVDVLRITNLDAPVLLDEAFMRFDPGPRVRAVLSRVKTPQRVRLQVEDNTCLHGVPEHFEIMIEHLLGNALLYSRPDSPVILLAEGHPSGVRFSVENQGFGVLPEHADRIFDAYFRGKEAASVNQRGSGLGLTICAKIAALHNTRISLDSEPRGVTRFEFIWPVNPRTGAV